MAVFYTTHYMEEAERLCHRLAIMDEGRFIAEGTVEELARLMGEESSVVVAFQSTPSSAIVARLQERGARQAGSHRFQMAGSSVEEQVAEILQMASTENIPIRELAVHRPNLGEVFFHLTGKALRD